jgi:excisionase family DNA binding protein
MEEEKENPGHATNPARLLTVADVAETLRVHPNYVYDLANRGDLPSYKIGGMRRFRAADVEAWLESRRTT